MTSGTAASVKLYAKGSQRPRVLAVEIELMSAVARRGPPATSASMSAARGKADPVHMLIKRVFAQKYDHPENRVPWTAQECAFRGRPEMASRSVEGPCQPEGDCLPLLTHFLVVKLLHLP